MRERNKEEHRLKKKRKMRHGVGGEREVQEGGDIGIPVADSCKCMVETNTIL